MSRWKITGQNFSWSRSTDGTTSVWLYPDKHEFAPEMICQNPLFEHEQVQRLNSLKANCVFSEGNSDELTDLVNERHRWVGYVVDADEGEKCIDFSSLVSLIDEELCLEARLGSVQLEQLIIDLTRCASFSGRYTVSLSDTWVDLNRSLGVRRDARSLFLSGEMPALIAGKLQVSFSFGLHAPH